MVIGREKFLYLDEKSVRAFFVFMVLVMNEFNVSFDELDDFVLKFMMLCECRKLLIVVVVEVIFNVVEVSYFDVSSGFLSRV